MPHPHPFMTRDHRITPDFSEYKPGDRVLVYEREYMLRLSDNHFILLTKEEWEDLQKRMDKDDVSIPSEKSYVTI